jgi:hypothetical protein
VNSSRNRTPWCPSIRECTWRTTPRVDRLEAHSLHRRCVLRRGVLGSAHRGGSVLSDVEGRGPCPGWDRPGHTRQGRPLSLRPVARSANAGRLGRRDGLREWNATRRIRLNDRRDRRGDPRRGGYFGSRPHIEGLSGESIPERCVPDGENDDRFAIIYEVEAGPFE